MATLSRLKPGQTVYVVRRQRVGNTTTIRKVVLPILIVEVDSGGVIASINYNPRGVYGPREIARWKVKRPEVTS